MKRWLRWENALALLLVFVPVTLVLEFLMGVHGTPIFVTASLAIIPLAGLMGRATEQLAHHVGAGLGGLLNATFGNAAELIIAGFALHAGLHDVVKASITGSIIGNVLLVFGLAALLGGLKFPVQKFNRTAASLGGTMLVLSAIGLVIPAIFHAVANVPPSTEFTLSRDIAIVLMASYALMLVFSLRTHPHLYIGDTAKAEKEGRMDASQPAGPGGEAGEADEAHHPSARAALVLLLASAAIVGVMSEMLVGAIEPAAEQFGMSEVFVGVILVALVGNAAEHSTAVLVAVKNKMDLSVNIAVGSSIQIALFAAPLLVFMSYVIGPAPMDLVFTPFEVVAVGLSVGIIALITHDGESHWMEGVQLLAVYVMLGMGFWFLPA
ncbi:MAG TPA: calcium/proton exchanger [Gemmatimonadota bacterium]|nr:calcium/proton exchanger [Gemmatimonadota bacterium]